MDILRTSDGDLLVTGYVVIDFGANNPTPIVFPTRSKAEASTKGSPTAKIFPVVDLGGGA